MKNLNELTNQLRVLNEQAMVALSIAPELTRGVEAIQRKREQLEKWARQERVKAPDAGRIHTALVTFFRVKNIQDIRHARYLCFGCTESVLPNSTSLLDHSSLFDELLKFVKSAQKEMRAFRLMYRGLLNAYFSVHPEIKELSKAAIASWVKLRDFLFENLLHIRDVNKPRDWIEYLHFNHEVLSEKPCDKFGKSLLEGNAIQVNEAKQQLNITDASWFMKLLVNAQVDAACVAEDGLFKELIPKLFELLKTHSLLLDRNLAKILDRYFKCAAAPQHLALRDFAVDHWKNPWLSTNQHKWARVEENTKTQITRWLKEKFIKQFFTFLADDGNNDQRRVAFWMQYTDQIEQMYFAFGRTALENRSIDFKQMRQEMQGLTFKLEAGGVPSNNAFIMKIRDVVIVEFGTTGNATYFFNASKPLPFNLSNAHQPGPLWGLYGDGRMLKNWSSPAFIDKLSHGGSWEYNFSYFLKNSLQISTDEQLAKIAKAQAEQAERNAITNQRRQAEINVLKELADQHSFTIKDNREKGGALWIEKYGGFSDELSKLLKSKGFIWSERNSSFYKSS